MVTDREEETRKAIDDHFSQSPHVRGQHWQAAGHGFQSSQAETFRQTRHEQEVRLGKDGGYVATQAPKTDVLFPPVLCEDGFDRAHLRLTRIPLLSSREYRERCGPLSGGPSPA